MFVDGLYWRIPSVHCAHCCVLSTIGNSTFSTILCATILLNNELVEVTSPVVLLEDPSLQLRLPHTLTLRHSPVSKGWMSGPSSYEAVDILDSSPDSSFAETTGSKLNSCNRWYVKRLGKRTTQDVADQYAVRVASARARVCDVTARRPSADRELAAGAKVGSRMLEDTSSVFV